MRPKGFLNGLKCQTRIIKLVDSLHADIYMQINITVNKPSAVWIFLSVYFISLNGFRHDIMNSMIKINSKSKCLGKAK